MRTGPICALVAALVLGPSAVAAGGAPRPPNLVLITVEGVRADRLGCAGWPGAQTRVLDRMAAEGVRFASCDTASPSSRPSHATILTGRFPPHHGVRGDDDVLAGGIPTVAERLAAAGYATAAVVGSSDLRRSSGLLRGFAVADDATPAGDSWPLAPGVRTAAEVAERAAAALDTLAAPFLLWVHFAGCSVSRDGGGAPAMAYDDCVAAIDGEIGRVRRAAGREATVVVVGAQGAMLGVHGEQGHGLLPLRGARRVPLLLAGPQIRAGAVERCLVRTADVAPTLLALAGAAALVGIDGESLLPLPSPFGRCGRRSFCEAFAPYEVYGWFPLQMVGNHRWTFVQGPRSGALYETRRDPLERRDLAGPRPGEAGRWLGALSRAMAGAAVAPLPSPLPDPRLEVSVHASVVQAAALVRQGSCGQALILIEPLVAAASRNTAALQLAARCELAAGKPEAALARWRRIAELRPEAGAAHAGLGECLLSLGRSAEAEVALRRALAIEPADGDSATRLAGLLLGRGEAEAALAVLDAAREAGGGGTAVYLERGRVRAARGDLEAALADFLEAADRSPGDPTPLEQAARTAVAARRFGDAAELYERLLRVAPERGEVWQALGSIYLERLQRRDAALRCFRQALSLAQDETRRRALSELVEKLSR